LQHVFSPQQYVPAGQNFPLPDGHSSANACVACMSAYTAMVIAINGLITVAPHFEHLGTIYSGTDWRPLQLRRQS
jgi:hypothetical protein